MHRHFQLGFIALICIAALQGCATTAPIDHKTADERHKLISDNMSKLAVGGRVTRVVWAENGESVSFTRSGERWQYTFDAGKLVRSNDDGAEERPPVDRRRNRAAPGRGRQRDREPSPDGKWIAVCKDWNVILEPAKGDADQSTQPDPSEPIKITTDGNRKFRYGTASWVYGEELDQREAMWWSPDSRKLVFYEFDERNVPDHFIAAGLTDLHTHVLTEGYPKPGEPNPIANLLIYDLETKQTIRVEPADDAANSYTYEVRFSPNGSELLFNRTNRHQDVLQFLAADLNSGKTRVVLTETQLAWQANSPEIKFLADGNRFIWATERTGYKQYELRNLDGHLLATLTHGDYPASSIIKVDEANNLMFYMAFSDANPLNAQLHRVALDGKKQMRLTKESLNHAVRISNDSKWFITEYEAVDTPPTAALYDTHGRRVATLAESDAKVMKELHLEKPELFSFKADDGKTDIYGVLYKPSHFQKSKEYPLAIDVYGGPLSQGVHNRFIGANANCEYGMLIASIDNRGTQNRGKTFESATYLKLGDVDIKDQVDGVRFLEKRPYIDSSRIGIYGHSYGGYMSALAILKYPDVFQVAAAGGTVTDWRNYDTIYTERFMRTPQENTEGYDAGSCLKYADQLRGHLLLLHGAVDDNVHSSNAWQLIDALEKANKPFEMTFYPNSGHSLGANANAARWRFLRKWLIDEPPHKTTRN